MLLASFAGFFAGLIHVFSGPDHLAAVAPLALPSRASGWRIGLRWGLGHCGGVTLVAFVAVAFRGVLPLDTFAALAEGLVGWVLVVLGVWGIRRVLTQHVHTHRHTHDGETHVHIHVHEASAHSDSETHSRHDHTHAAFAIGTLHGLAGSSHFLAVLPALAFPTHGQAAGYVVAYGIGTVVAMVLFSSMLASVGGRVSARRFDWYRAMAMSASVVAILVGGWWIIS